jgi:hypothetical protein
LIDKLFNKLENERLILISNERDKRKWKKILIAN